LGFRVWNPYLFPGILAIASLKNVDAHADKA
jgi:hypothetical protein